MALESYSNTNHSWKNPEESIKEIVGTESPGKN